MNEFPILAPNLNREVTVSGPPTILQNGKTFRFGSNNQYLQVEFGVTPNGRVLSIFLSKVVDGVEEIRDEVPGTPEQKLAIWKTFQNLESRIVRGNSLDDFQYTFRPSANLIGGRSSRRGKAGRTSRRTSRTKKVDRRRRASRKSLK